MSPRKSKQVVIESSNDVDLWSKYVESKKIHEYRPDEGWRTSADFAAECGINLKPAQVFLNEKAENGEMDKKPVMHNGKRKFAYRPIEAKRGAK